MWTNIPSGIEKAIGITKLFNIDLITLPIVLIARNRAIRSGFIFDCHIYGILRNQTILSCLHDIIDMYKTKQ